MKLSGSRIPHLARALAEKRRLGSGSPIAQPGLLSLNAQSISRSTQYAGPVSVFSRQSSHATSPFLQSGAPPKRRPTRPLPAISKVPPINSESSSGRYDPSKDPRKVKNYLVFVSSFAAIVGTYIFYAITTYRIELRKYNESPDKLLQDADVSDRWCDEKRNFDYEIEGQERISWMKGKRRRLIREAYGDVLEVSVGTGRNMDLYDTRPFSDIENSKFGRSTRHMITSLTFNDQSPVMIERAQQKWEEDQKKRHQSDRFVGATKFITGDARVEGVIPRPNGGYDTIVQSMGLCSMAEPVKFLRLLGRLARQPGEPVVNSGSERIRKEESADGRGGRIFLLEHGRAHDWYGWLNSYLDNSAAMHANRYGCWYNKDIKKIIEESGLVVERVERHYFGTVLEIVLRPAPGSLPDEEALKKPTMRVAEQAKPTSGGLSNLWK